jgi:signal transduction histidine kinase
MAVGFVAFLTTPAESSNDVLYSIGRVAGWVIEILLLYLILVFPSGRLESRIDRALVVAGILVLGLLYLPAALLVDGYPVPNMYTSCDASCPDNTFRVLGTEPGWVDSVVLPLREVLTIALFAAVTARLSQRVRQATPLMRRGLEPVFIVAMIRWALLVLALGGRRVEPDSAVVEALIWMIALTLPALAAGFLIGLVRWRFFVGDRLQGLVLGLHANLSPEALRVALAEAFGDPYLTIVYPADDGGGGWIAPDGRSVELPPSGSGRRATEVRSGDHAVAAIIHDAGLEDHGELMSAGVSYARIALENQRLSAELESSLGELRESRSRFVAMADRERKAIERDLHDGAQQRLVALRIRLALAEDLVRTDPRRGAERLHALGDEVTSALEEIRDLAHGVYPSLLVDRGLTEALRAAALRAPIRTEVIPDGIGRYPPELESAVYFCCLEGLQNASKHADGATRVVIALEQRRGLRFEVRDDGAGFNGETRFGVGLTNMRDRLAAVDGELSVNSAPDEGTVVAGTIPLA